MNRNSFFLFRDKTVQRILIVKYAKTAQLFIGDINIPVQMLRRRRDDFMDIFRSRQKYRSVNRFRILIIVTAD